MQKTVSRRDFLKLGGLSLAALAFRPAMPDAPFGPSSSSSALLGRVTRSSIPLYSRPDLNSPHSDHLLRDTILRLLEEVISPYGPPKNPRWYRLEQGFVHSAYIQRVDGSHLNPTLAEIPESGLPGEVTVPYAQSLYKKRDGTWMPLYRLYYHSMHWITGLFDGEDGKPWYRLTDEWLRISYRVPAETIRPVVAEEFMPLSPEIPPEEKRIEISLENQQLLAFESQEQVYQADISSGVRYMETPQGDFFIERKHPSKHMGNGGLTNDPRAYELVGVPWASFFHPSGIAFHGTYWHDNFGTPMSHGCVNMRNEDALWLFRWCSPAYPPKIQNRSGWKVAAKGTPVRVR